MTQYVSIHEAKTHLSRLIKEISEGKDIVITSYGKPVAMLAPAVKPKKRIIGDLKAWGEKHPLPADFDKPMPDEWFFPNPNKFSES